MSKDDYYEYSDDFVSEEDEPKGRRSNPKKTTYGIKVSNKSFNKPKGRGKGRGGTSSQKPSPRIDNVAQRMLSASRIKMNELRNQVEDQTQVIRDLREENKLLKKMQYRQERALGKFEDQESDLPRLILKHNNEVRSYKEQIRNAKDKFEKTDRYLRDAEDDLERATAKLKKYKSLVDNKNLLERDELNRKLSKVDRDLEEKDSKISELQRHIDHLTKNHRHELGVEIARHRDTKRQAEQMRENIENVENKLREKEKELDIKNIYSNRVMRPPHKLPASYSGTPLDSPPSGNARKRIPSISEMTAREKAKMFELKRREEMKKKQQAKPRPRQEKPLDAFASHQSSMDEERNRLFQVEKERREEEDRFIRAQEEENARERERLREQERERERTQREREEADFRRERERMKRESEELEARRKRDKEDREREDRERREREERERMEREERERREQYERQKDMEAKAREERERLENDPREQDERRKKDLLLARMRALDDGQKENVSPVNRSPFDDDTSTPSSKKSYSFSKPVENLHSGKPAYEEVSVPYIEKRKQQKNRDDDFGYNPSFGRRASGSGSGKGAGETSSPVRKPTRKAALMDELFGNQTSAPQKDDDFLFGTADNKKQTSKRSSGFILDDSSSSKPADFGFRARENSSALFGGGAALIEDDSPSDKTKLLPRRSRHQSSTYSSKPVVTAVDNYDDDIEEVML